MHSHCPRKITRTLLALALAAPAVISQEPQDPRTRIRVTSELVVVPVTVKDGSGKSVLDLRQSEFRVFEDNIEQNVSLFSVDPFPLSAVILVDNDLKQKSAEMVQQTLRALAGGFSESDEVAVCLFDIQFNVVADFQTNTDALFTQLKRMDVQQTFPGQGSGPMTAGPRVGTAPQTGPPTQGRTGIMLGGAPTKNLNDALFAAGQMLRDRDRSRRKLIYLISDGENSRHNTNSFQDTLKMLLTADVAVYAIGVGNAVLNRGLTPLSRYAHATGGDVFYASRREELETLYTQVADQARNQYTLGYIPQKTDRALDYHSIEVRVRRPGLTLLARDGYYTVPRP